MIQVLFILFGVVLVFWGLYRMKNDPGFFGKNKKSRSFFNFLLMGEASGLGQLLGGILCIIIGILSFIIK